MRNEPLSLALSRVHQTAGGNCGSSSPLRESCRDATAAAAAFGLSRTTRPRTWAAWSRKALWTARVEPQSVSFSLLPADACRTSRSTTSNGETEIQLSNYQLLRTLLSDPGWRRDPL